MPLYDFKCECGHADSEYRAVANWDDPMICPICGGKMRHDLVAQHASVRGDFKKPIVSDSMGFVATPEAVAEHRQLFPDIELDVSEGCARPVLRSLSQKRAYMKKQGWIDKKAFC